MFSLSLFRKQQGFTLIELMVVMAIIAILSTAGLSAYTNYINKALITKGREFDRGISSSLVDKLALQVNCDGNILDSSGANKSITGTVTEYREGISGQGCNLKGSALYTNSTGISSPLFTLSVWVKMESNDIPLGAFITYMQYGQSGFSLGIGNNGRLFFSNTGYPGGAVSYTATQTIHMKKWRHVAVAYDGNSAKVYINGVLDGQTGSFTYIPTTNNSFMINHNWGAFDPDLTYDDVRFYTSNLLVGNIEKMYKEGASRYLAQK